MISILETLYVPHPEIPVPIGRKGLVNSKYHENKIVYVSLSGEEKTKEDNFEEIRDLIPVHVLEQHDEESQILMTFDILYVKHFAYCIESYDVENAVGVILCCKKNDPTTIYIVQSNNENVFFSSYNDLTIINTYQVPLDSIYWEVPCYNFPCQNLKLSRSYLLRYLEVIDVKNIVNKGSNISFEKCEVNNFSKKDIVCCQLPYNFILTRDQNGTYLWVEKIEHLKK